MYERDRTRFGNVGKALDTLDRFQVLKKCPVWHCSHLTPSQGPEESLCGAPPSSKSFPVLCVLSYFLIVHRIFLNVPLLKDDLVTISACIFSALFDDRYFVFYLLTAKNKFLLNGCLNE